MTSTSFSELILARLGPILEPSWRQVRPQRTPPTHQKYWFFNCFFYILIFSALFLHLPLSSTPRSSLRAILGHLRPSWGPPWAPLGPLSPSWGLPGILLGPSLGLLWAIWGPSSPQPFPLISPCRLLGLIFGHLGLLLGPLRPVLGPLLELPSPQSPQQLPPKRYETRGGGRSP